MKAMILAAGIGHRLRPLTDRCPKALIEVGGMPMLEIVIRRLMAAGVREIVVNVFHQADRIARFLEERGNFGLRIELSPEEALLDTGGGLKQASWFFDDDRPFFLHNVDVLTDIDLVELRRFHETHPALATLAVQTRQSARALLFGSDGGLRGWRPASPAETRWVGEPDHEAVALAFTGIHVISAAIFANLSETGAFPIHRAYLRLAAEGCRIQAFRADGRYWADIGTEAQLTAARAHAVATGLALG